MKKKTLLILAIVIIFIIGIYISLKIGKVNSSLMADFDFKIIKEVLFNYDENNVDQYIMRDIRIPRIIGAILGGSLLAVAGAVMQSITRNYLADPSVVGVNAGASLGLTIGFFTLGGNTSYMQNVFFSMCGAGIATVIIFIIAGQIKGKDSKVKLIIVGTALGMLFSAISGVIGFGSALKKDLAMWSSVGVVGMKWIGIEVLLIGVIGLFIAFVYARRFTVLGLGDEMAISLGENVQKIKMMGILAVVLMTAPVISVIGNIGFVGLMLPNIAKMLCGEDYRKIISISAVGGAIFFMYSDIISRLLNYPYETPIASITSVLGIPFMLYLVNSKKGNILSGKK